MDIESIREKGIENCGKEELVAVCQTMGIAYHPNNNETSLREKIRAAWGEGPMEMSGGERQVPKSRNKKTSIGGEGKILPTVNLSPNGRWEGRRELITLINQDAQVNKDEFPQYSAWDTQEVFVPFNVHCDVPWPIFMILNNAVGYRRQSKQTMKEDGRRFIQHEWKEQRRFAVTHHGVKPGTEDLPCSLQDHYLQPEILKRLDAMSKMDKPNKLQLRKACQSLGVAAKVEMPLNKMTSHEMIEGIYETINYDPEMVEAA